MLPPVYTLPLVDLDMRHTEHANSSSNTTTSTISPADKDEEAVPAAPTAPAETSETSWAAISQAIVGFILFLNSWGLINTFGVFQTLYASGFIPHVTNSQISWIGSLQGFFLLVTMIITGPIFDRGYARELTILGSFLVVFGMMMTSLCKAYWQFILAQGLTIGLGNGCLFIVSAGLISLNFKRHRLLVLGISAAAGSLGGIIFPLIFRAIHTSSGFPWATRALGFIILGTQILAIALIRIKKLKAPRIIVDIRAFHTPAFMVFGLTTFIAYLGLYIPFFYITDYSRSAKVSASTDAAFYSLITMNAASIPGRILPGYAADNWGQLNTITICTVGAMITAFSWLSVHTYGEVTAFAVFYGFFSGSFVSLVSGVLASLAPEPAVIGTWVGMGCVFPAIGLLIGTPVGGSVFQNGGWTALQLFCASLVAAAMVLVAITRVVKAGFALKIKA